jgi:hypothetical protein
MTPEFLASSIQSATETVVLTLPWATTGTIKTLLNKTGVVASASFERDDDCYFVSGQTNNGRRYDLRVIIGE